ncbi:MAG: hypothetical protein AAFY98_09175 [Verrucomicrobiota bacterium]
MKFSILLSAVVASLFLIISCAQDAGLVGVWKADPEKNHFAVDTIEFKEDGTFLFGKTEGKWEKVEEGRITWNFKNVLPNKYDYTIVDGVLTLKDQMGIAGVFTRNN